MEDSQYAPMSLWVYECRGPERHRVYRKDNLNKGPCSRCDNNYNLIAEVPRLAGESEQTHHIRALASRRQKVKA